MVTEYMTHKGATTPALGQAHVEKNGGKPRARRSNTSEKCGEIWEYKKQCCSSHSGTEAQPAASETDSQRRRQIVLLMSHLTFGI